MHSVRKRLKVVFSAFVDCSVNLGDEKNLVACHVCVCVCVHGAVCVCVHVRPSVLLVSGCFYSS